MKLVLITLPSEGQFVNWTVPEYYYPSDLHYMPLGLLSLATNLPEEYNVKILDASSENWSIKETIERIEQEKPDVLGISSVTQKVYALYEILKKVNVPYKVVGGAHALHYAEQIIQKGADAVFIGSFADLEFKEAVKTRPKGIIYCKTSIKDIKFPRRDLLDVNKYFPKTALLFKAENRLPMFTSSGCPHKCIFCDVQNKKVEYKSPQIIVDEMQYLLSVGAKSIHILDDNFNVNERQVHAIIDEMNKRNLTLEWSGRGEARISDGLAKRLAENNFKRIHVGIESLSDEVLKYLRKSVRVKDIYNFCEIMKKYNIGVVSFFILGSPVETEEYRYKLPKMIKELGIKSPYFNILFPLPNTEYYIQLLRDGIYTKDFWAEYMENPIPNFRIPYPYGEKRHNEIIKYVKEMIEYFERLRGQEKEVRNF